ncbi:uncharacterized protein LOC129216991 [Uloborus diversus]|uniref:uncharacterized protein LOC129216991 n=1 Tax=Uloborus diversus TaxID=327109 RepID=UPI00240A9383|nr:uncharacterized protein LOC129216991 [Uloborus diversus]
MNCSCFLSKCNFQLETCFRVTARFLSYNCSKNVSNEASNFRMNVNSLPISHKNLYPWKTKTEFSQLIVSSIIHNKDGLIAINKPYGVKTKNFDKSGPVMDVNQSIPDYTLEDAMPALQEHLNVPELIVSKTCERYSSGVVLLSSSKKIDSDVTKSFRIARHQQKNHLTHWIITLGYPVLNFKKETVGLNFLRSKESKTKQAIIVDSPSKRSRKRRTVLFYRVEYQAICVNPSLETSLIEISSSSDTSHFIRVYASNCIAPVLGDPIYSCRMKKLLGIPVKVHLQNFESFKMQPISDQMAAKLSLPKGVIGHTKIPTMLHLRKVLLPSFNGEDLLISAELPPHFQWMAKTMNLL